MRPKIYKLVRRKHSTHTLLKCPALIYLNTFVNRVALMTVIDTQPRKLTILLQRSVKLDCVNIFFIYLDYTSGKIFQMLATNACMGKIRCEPMCFLQSVYVRATDINCSVIHFCSCKQLSLHFVLLCCHKREYHVSLYVFRSWFQSKVE